MKNVIKVLTALATVAGAVYIIATYGEQIVAWAKKLLNAMPKCPKAEEAEDEAVIEVNETAEAPAEEAAEAPAEEAAEAPAEEEAPAAEEPAAEEPAPEVAVAANEPVADESDFAE